MAALVRERLESCGRAPRPRAASAGVAHNGTRYLFMLQLTPKRMGIDTLLATVLSLIYLDMT
eukprot:scaffold64884_cov41-Phaeocystis_antarctica.AAC.1